MRRKLIGEFLAEVSDNPEHLRQYAQDLEGFLRGRDDLTDDQKNVLLTRDLKKIRDAVRDEYQKAEVIVVPLPVQHVA